MLARGRLPKEMGAVFGRASVMFSRALAGAGVQGERFCVLTRREKGKGGGQWRRRHTVLNSWTVLLSGVSPRKTHLHGILRFQLTLFSVFRAALFCPTGAWLSARRSAF